MHFTKLALSFQVYLGSHGFYGEDGIELIADRAIGRDDYGQPQCSFRKRSNQNKCESTSTFRQSPRAWGPPRSIWQMLFGGNSPVLKRQGLVFGSSQRTKQDVTFTNDIALIKLKRKVRFSRKIQPIRLPSNKYGYLGYQAYVAGWGIQSPSEGPSQTLKGAELVVSALISCNS